MIILSDAYISLSKKGDRLKRVGPLTIRICNYLKNLPISGMLAPSFLLSPFKRTMMMTYSNKPSIPVSMKLAHIGKISIK